MNNKILKNHCIYIALQFHKPLFNDFNQCNIIDVLTKYIKFNIFFKKHSQYCCFVVSDRAYINLLLIIIYHTTTSTN